jgi:putative tryptophan/tyrosine transport system substrate-binding protein
LAARHRFPAVYPFRYVVAEGGLVSYGEDVGDLFRRAATYMDRILWGEQPRDLPVQAPTSSNWRSTSTARALGLDVPPILPATADEVIE